VRHEVREERDRWLAAALDEEVVVFPLPPCRVETRGADSAAYHVSVSHFEHSRPFYLTIEDGLWPRARQGNEQRQGHE